MGSDRQLRRSHSWTANSHEDWAACRPELDSVQCSDSRRERIAFPALSIT